MFGWVELDSATVDVFPVFKDMLSSVEAISGGSEDVVTVTVYKPRETLMFEVIAGIALDGHRGHLNSSLEAVDG